MGLKFKGIVNPKEISLKELNGKILSVDSMNILYQFLTTIVGMDGSPLTDSKGRVTSHLIGLFNRTVTLMEAGIKLVFVFDGKPPEIKRKTWEIRRAVKETAKEKYLIAEEAGDQDEMKKFARQKVSLSKEMVEDAKNILVALGIPIVQAPSEGEAQAAYMVSKGDCYGVVSQDFDNLIFGATRLIRNLSLAGKRKKGPTYQRYSPEMIKLQDVLNELKLNRDQLIILAILVGTDYNPGGIKGIGPKKGLKLLHEHKAPEDIFEAVKWSEHNPDLHWKEIFDTIKDIPVTDDYNLEWGKINNEELIHLLVSEYGFAEDRVKTRLEKMQKNSMGTAQKGLSSFF